MPKLSDFKATRLDGSEEDLGTYDGKVVLVVNTASECGFTPQFEGLEKLYEQYADQGLVVLGFPCNQFGGQEPGSNKEIKAFCSTKFGITFPLFSKITVKGPNKHPLYAMLVQTPPEGEVSWNFNKFLVGKDGKVTALVCEQNGERVELKADLVLLAMGFLGPCIPGAVEQSGVNLTDRGNVDAAFGEFRTSNPRIFACGDMRRGQSLVVWAIREGRDCARSIHAPGAWVRVTGPGRRHRSQALPDRVPHP